MRAASVVEGIFMEVSLFSVVKISHSLPDLFCSSCVGCMCAALYWMLLAPHGYVRLQIRSATINMTDGHVMSPFHHPPLISLSKKHCLVIYVNLYLCINILHKTSYSSMLTWLKCKLTPLMQLIVLMYKYSCEFRQIIWHKKLLLLFWHVWYPPPCNITSHC